MHILKLGFQTQASVRLTKQNLAKNTLRQKSLNGGASAS